MPRITVRSLHILLGVTLGVVILLRMVWRASSGRRLPLAAPGFIGYGAKLVHYGLYLLVVATVALGIANVWVRGDSIFGLLTVPKLAPGDQVLEETLEDLHGWFANAVLILAGLHAAAALVITSPCAIACCAECFRVETRSSRYRESVAGGLAFTMP